MQIRFLYSKFLFPICSQFILLRIINLFIYNMKLFTEYNQFFIDGQGKIQE